MNFFSQSKNSFEFPIRGFDMIYNMCYYYIYILPRLLSPKDHIRDREPADDEKMFLPIPTYVLYFVTYTMLLYKMNF